MSNQLIDFDANLAVGAMERFGLSIEDATDVQGFLDAYQQNVNNRDPHAGDRYVRAAQAAANRKKGDAILAQSKELGKKGSMALNDLWQAANAKADPLEYEPDPVSILDDDPDALESVVFGGAEQDPNDEITAQAWRMMLEAGIDIFDDDPESKLVVSDGTEEQFLQSIQTAIDKKRLRLSWQGEKPDMNSLWQAASKKL